MILQFDPTPLREALADAEPGVLDGRAVSSARLSQLEPLVEQLITRGAQPTLCVVQVGDDDASSLYIRHKIRACSKIGVESRHVHLSADITRDALLARLRILNDDPTIHGILLQLPLPDHLDQDEPIRSIDPGKDVDGFHPVNLGCMMSRRSILEPCTPRGVLTLLQAAGIDPTGKEAVVIGRSVIVGRPMSLMLTRANATVTTCHRHTVDLEREVRRAEILVVATGVAELVKGEWIRDGAVVVDVGISRKDGKLSGDVEFAAARERAAWITPVPGGVGPMTVATLLENTVRAACVHHDVVARDGEIIDARQAGLEYSVIDGLGITTLRRSRTN
jgi:methylenetetrahydrofolate dehydrogenase (NADP+) / methenyltetrahydrofolate cyclohydrolase